MKQFINIFIMPVIQLVLLFIFLDIAIAQGGFISGTVYEADGRKPVYGARVSAFKSTPACVGFGITNAEGEYIIQNLGTGIYEVRTSVQGFSPSVKSNISVNNNMITPAINFTLDRRVGSISGKVYRSNDSSPISGALLHASEPSGRAQTSAITDENGAYKLGNLPEGIYDVAISSPGFASNLYQGVVVLAQKDQSNVNFVLTEEGTISGRITDQDLGTPVGDAGIIALAMQDDTFFHSKSDSSGNYIIGGLPAGLYKITVQKSGYLSVSRDNVEVINGENTLEIDMALSKTGFISGKVYGEDGISPVPNAVVIVFNSGEKIMSSGITETGEDGIYVVEDLGPGENYEVAVVAEGFESASISNISVVSGQITTNVDFYLISE